QRFYEAYSRNPATAVEEQIEGARRRVSQLQLKILQETGGSMVAWVHPRVPMSWTHGSVSPLLPGRLSLDSQDGDSGLESGTERFPSVSEVRNGCDSLFQDLGKLKSRPAHLGVFLRYIFSQADPSPLLFYLCTEVCQQVTPKDSRVLGKDIWNIFLDRNA
ncbi:ARHGB factor, partial [Pedionomus torquatus]|nr:ARHGB factor [Pedionomus torquatus]